ncbi:LysE family translocator [Aliamphritea ceti]|uniref:LysE family translocator n=1 Tax=Aliamphritea ceti TaxID=1524258 RepID=UPI0021C3116F|nr:LysE family transporter [Aliamphritea ceti]
MIEAQTQFVLIGIVILLAVISPGPDFAITTRNSLMYGRCSGLATAIGIAAGVSVHVVYTLFGLGYIMAEAVWLLEVMRYLGAGYLIWLGVSAFLPGKGEGGSKTGLAVSGVAGWTAFKNGFICNALNPKTALFFIALFTQVVDPATPLIIQVLIGVFISVAHFVWFGIVALLLTHPRFNQMFARARVWIERVTGACLVGLGAKLAINA